MLMEHLPDGLEIDGLEVSDEVISDGDAHVRLGRYEGQAVAIELVKNDGAPSRSVEPSAHPNVVRLIKQVAHGEWLLDVRPLCGDGELFDVVFESGGLGGELATALPWLRQLASAVAHCHAERAVCGQLRPEHVLLHEGAVQLLGFRRWQCERAPLRPRASHDAPELEGKTEATADELVAADRWALGVVAFFVLAGAPPPPAAECAGGARVAALLADAGAPEGVASVVAALLQPAPEARPPAAAVLARLDALASGADGASPAVSTPAVPTPPAPAEAAPAPAGGALKRSHSQLAMPPPSGPPFRPSASAGYVRCLGWEALPHRADALADAVGASLAAVGAQWEADGGGFAFSVRPRVSAEDAARGEQLQLARAVSSGGGLPLADAAAPVTPASLPLGGVPLGGIPLGTPSPALSGAEKELLVLVNIYKAEGELHHVDVRRRDGPQWQFYLFYSEFRRAMSEKLGMGDYSQLSMYSPLIGRDRRQVPAARLGGQTAFGFGAGGRLGADVSESSTGFVRRRPAAAAP